MSESEQQAPKSQAQTPAKRKRGGRILRSTAALPALFTIGNGLAGFAAIHFATKDGLAAGKVAVDAVLTNNLAMACWLVFVAMICDMLDGRVARLTRRTSDFGGQLDSMCDVISFGVAPAVIMVHTVLNIMRMQMINFPWWEFTIGQERVVMVVAGVYVACAAIRLARFNVENDPDESAHMSFSGLPSPGAAAVVISLALLRTHLGSSKVAWLGTEWMLIVVCCVLLVTTLFAGLLMVSRFRYPHIVNKFIRGRRPLNYIIKLVVIVLASLLEPYVAIAAIGLAYTVYGPVAAVFRRMGKPRPVKQ